MRITAALVGLAVVAILATSGLVYVLLTQPFAPAEVAAASPATSAQVVTQEFLDERTVSISVTVGEPTSAVLPSSGRVTDLACSAGEVIASGTAPLAIDGTPVLALHLSVPPWRNLDSSSRGKDVAAVRAELRRLGFDVGDADDDAPLGTAAITAFRELAARNGITGTSTSTIDLRSTIWLSEPELAVESCRARLGASIMAGDELARTAPPIEKATIATRPANLAPGDRVLALDGIDLAVDDQGAITDLGALSTSPSYRAAIAEAASIPEGALTATLRLAEPVEVAVVPPGSVTTLDGTTGCVTSTDGALHAARIVGSQLGQTFVVFDEAPEAVALAGPSACP